MSDTTITQVFPPAEGNSTQKTTSHLRLVASNPNPVKSAHDTLLSSPTVPNEEKQDNSPDLTPFSAMVGAGTYNQFIMKAVDSSHCLECVLKLKIEPALDEHETNIVTCRFPEIDTDGLESLIGEDETLHGIIMIGFQMKILEQLLLFCAEHDARTLHILVDQYYVAELEIYQKFVLLQVSVPSLSNPKVKLNIPAGHDAYDRWVDFMHNIDLEFKQQLWRQQRENWAIRSYLKTRPLLTQD